MSKTEQKETSVTSQMSLQEKAARAVEVLKQVYPQAVCALEWMQGSPVPAQAGDRTARAKEAWKLLIMARLSAQCTDARVNLVCRTLFAAYPTVQAVAEAPLTDLEAIVRPCGLYHTKAENIRDACAILVRDYDGLVPERMEELLALPGVGRKIANLVRGDVYGYPGVVCDTHCIRICGRLGFYDTALKDPAKVEKILTPLLPSEEQSDFCHRIVQFGRDTCMARGPQCEVCPLQSLCTYYAAAGATEDVT